MKFLRFASALLLVLGVSMAHAKMNLSVSLNGQTMEGVIDLNQVVIIFGENNDKGEQISRMYFAALAQDEKKVTGAIAITVVNEEGKMAPICDDIPVELNWNEQRDIKFTETFTMGLKISPIEDIK